MQRFFYGQLSVVKAKENACFIVVTTENLVPLPSDAQSIFLLPGVRHVFLKTFEEFLGTESICFLKILDVMAWVKFFVQTNYNPIDIC